MRRALVPLLAVTTAAVLVTPLATAATPSPVRSPAGSTAGPTPVHGLDDPRGPSRGYPRQTELREYDEDPTDASIKLGLIPFHEIAPRLNDLQERSDRVSVEVVGQSVQGRDLYLVTVTEPERAAETTVQDRLRKLIVDDPERASSDARLARDYKAPFFINANIHGNEWEGTDGALRVVEDLALSTDPEVEEQLENSRLHVLVTSNPDGRVAGTRANAAGFDLNRDFITTTHPETAAIKDVVVGAQPLITLDMHGYTGTTLLHPSTPPHGQSYDYDLYLQHAWPNALAMEEGIQALGYPETEVADIPFRDREPGTWDDWPPVYVPSYSIFHGAVSHTVEVPLRVNNREYTSQPVEELRRRSAINTDVVEATALASWEYLHENRDSLLENQIELFRRGTAGEAQPYIPDEFIPGFDEQDRFSTTFPRTYVIPAVQDQRSPAAARRLVDHMLRNDLEVQRATADFTLEGRDYPAGTYLVDMHQPKRGLANAWLEDGRDITDRVPAMYDISGWSLARLWGADVVAAFDDAPPSAVRAVTAASPTGAVTGSSGDLALDLQDPTDVQAATALLAEGVGVGLTADGTVVVDGSARDRAQQLADELGVAFDAAPTGADADALGDVQVAVAGAADERYVVEQLGFSTTPVSNAVLEDGFDWSEVDVLVVASGLTVSSLGTEARAGLDAFLERGGVVALGANGGRFNAEAGLLETTTVSGRSDANGVVSVTNADGSAVTAGALPHSFVYAPVWFADLGSEVQVDQSYAEQDVLLAGHWRPDANGAGGQDSAAGQASVVSGTSADGTPVVQLGTRPLFRDTPKGLYAQVARAILSTSVR